MQEHEPQMLEVSEVRHPNYRIVGEVELDEVGAGSQQLEVHDGWRVQHQQSQ